MGNPQAEVLDYSIHYLEPHSLLIAHMRYIGSDFDGDMAQIAADENTKRWWKVSWPLLSHVDIRL